MVIVVVLPLFSFPCADDTMEVVFIFFFEGNGDGCGTKLVILRNGSLNLEGPSGGFFSVTAF